MKLLRIMAAASLLISSFVAAEVKQIGDNNTHLTLRVTQTYTLGDNDTFIDAKNISLAQAQRQAADFAGTYVEQSLVVDGDKITQQQIRVLTAGFTEIIKSEEKRHIDDNGGIELVTQATIRVSKESIKDGLAKLKTDPDRLATIAALETDNARLRADLDKLSKQINTGIKSSDSEFAVKHRPDLVGKRDDVLQQLESNRNSVKQVFAKGSLLQIAQSNTSDYDLARQRLDDEFFDHYRYSTNIRLGDPEFTENASGNSYNLRVLVRWHLDSAPIEAFFKDYFEYRRPLKGVGRSSQIPMLEIHRYSNNANKQKKAFTSKLFDDMSKQEILIKITAGDYSAFLPIVGLTDGRSFPGRDFAKGNAYRVQYSSSAKQQVYWNVSNPVEIKNIPASKLNKITSIDAEVIVRGGR